MIASLIGKTTTAHIEDDSAIPENRRLPEKFDWFILNNPLVKPEIRKKIQEAFADKTESLFWGFYKTVTKPEYKCKESKNHVRTYKGLDGWIIKFDRTDLNVGQDAHIYRVRKARKIRNFIEKNHWENVAVAPEKYLYYHSKTDKWYVMAQKLDLRDMGRMTTKQAEVAARIVLEANIPDAHHENIKMDSKGRIAFCDTEPVTRGEIKKLKKAFWAKCLVDIPLLKSFFGQIGAERLKGSVPTAEGKKAITAVQWEYFKKDLAKAAMKIALLAITYYFIGIYPPVTSLIRFALATKITALAAQIIMNAAQITKYGVNVYGKVLGPESVRG